MALECYDYTTADILADGVLGSCLKREVLEYDWSANLVSLQVFDSEDIAICFDTPLIESGPSPTEKDVLDNIVYNHRPASCTSNEVSEDEYLAAAKEPTGFLTYKVGSKISRDNNTRTFTVEPDSDGSPIEYDDYTVFFTGVKRVYDEEKTVVWPDEEGIHFIYFEEVTQELETTQVFTIDILEQHAFVSVLYWDKEHQKTIYFGCERHGCAMDGRSHSHFHQTLHTQWTGGLALEDLVCCQDGSSDTHAQFSVTDGSIRDEDLLININDGDPQDLDPIANIRLFWRIGEYGSRKWRARDGDNFPIIYDGDGSGYTAVDSPGRPAYNPLIESGSPLGSQLVEVDEGKFFNMHYFATNDVDSPVIGIVGDNQYDSREDARTGANEEVNIFLSENGTGEFQEIPFAEFTPIATVLFEASSSYTNSVKARTRTLPDGELYIDWRGTGVNPASEATIGVHGALQNLGADDHEQYLTEGRHDALPYDNPHNVQLEQLGDINFGSPGPNDGDILIYQASPGIWVPGVADAFDISLAQLTDTDVASPAPTDGQVLTWDASPEKWIAVDSQGGDDEVDPGPGNENFSGSWIELTAGENLSFGDICFVQTNTKLYKANNSTANDLPAMYMAVESITANNTGKFLRTGTVQLDSWNWTAGNSLFVGNTVGSMTHDKPHNESNKYIQFLAVPITSKVVDFRPDGTLIQQQGDDDDDD